MPQAYAGHDHDKVQRERLHLEFPELGLQSESTQEDCLAQASGMTRLSALKTKPWRKISLCACNSVITFGTSAPPRVAVQLLPWHSNNALPALLLWANCMLPAEPLCVCPFLLPSFTYSSYVCIPVQSGPCISTSRK